MAAGTVMAAAFGVLALRVGQGCIGEPARQVGVGKKAGTRENALQLAVEEREVLRHDAVIGEREPRHRLFLGVGQGIASRIKLRVFQRDEVLAGDGGRQAMRTWLAPGFSMVS